MVSMDVFASAFGFDAKSDDVWTALGKVTAINGNKLSVLLGGSATPTECEAYCHANVGDVVSVVISKGRARAIANRGGDSANGIINSLEIGTASITDDDTYIITQNTNATEQAYYRRPVSKLWAYIKSKANSFFLAIAGGTQIADNTDLDTLLDFGRYSCGTSAKAKTLTNCPIEKAFIMFTSSAFGGSPGSTTYLCQDIVEYDTGKVWHRYKGTDSWGAWTYITESLEGRVSQLEQDNYSFNGWGGWNVLLNNNAFVAGCEFTRTITEKNSFSSSPSNYNYSQQIYFSAPMPFETLNIAGTTDRDLQSIVSTNASNNCGISLRVVTPWNYTIPRDTRLRIVLTGFIKSPPENPTPEYNSTIGQQIANIALTYYDAATHGREFKYGRNFFYTSSPSGIINDENGEGCMECDTFVGMALRGIPYEKSPYSVLTENYTYEYEDLYQDVSGATNWAASTAYSVGALVIRSGLYWKCKTAHTSGSTFNESYWEHVWVTNPNGLAWATAMNAVLHPANQYLQRDILYAGDVAFIGWQEGRVFNNPDQAFSGDVAFWVRRAKTPTYWGGSSQSPAFDNIGHVGIVYIENGQKYILHVTADSFFEKTTVNKTPIEEFLKEQPSYYYRPLYS